MSDAGALMDGIYARQRHIYDATRKFYLLGRDTLIRDLAVSPGGTILEIGCGTGRNLIKIARRYPDSPCYGLDISSAMLTTARNAVARAGLSDRVCLKEADATSFDPITLFGRETFDRVVISYALSMIPPWRDVLDQATGALAPGGSLHVVDFGDQALLPKSFATALHAWLRRFHVYPRATLPSEIMALASRHGLVGATRPLFRGYAIKSEIKRPLS